jgi:hypothetical protein
MTASQFAGKDPAPSVFARAHELEEFRSGGMAKLSARHRKVLEMKAQGRGYPEIAKAFGFRDEQTARALMHRALSNLRKHMAEFAPLASDEDLLLVDVFQVRSGIGSGEVRRLRETLGAFFKLGSWSYYDTDACELYLQDGGRRVSSLAPGTVGNAVYLRLAFEPRSSKDKDLPALGELLEMAADASRGESGYLRTTGDSPLARLVVELGTGARFGLRVGALCIGGSCDDKVTATRLDDGSVRRLDQQPDEARATLEQAAGRTES